MSVPSFENIEQWLFEYAEGNLSPKQEASLMEFIAEHPELTQELHAWRSSKANTEEAPAGLTALLLKPTPFFLRTSTLVSMGFVVGLMAFMFYNFYPKAPLYTAENLDIKIIHVGSSSDGVLIASNSVIKENSNNTDNHFIAEISSGESSDNLNNNRFNNNIAQAFSSEVEDVSDQENTYSDFNNSNNYITYRIEDYKNLDAINSSENTSDNLIKEDVSSSTELNKGLKAEEVDKKDDLTHVSTPRSVTKKSFKSVMNGFIRKIDRITSKPIALQSTQQPHYHTPMMTGFKANPSMVGSGLGNRIQATSRLQWAGTNNSQLLNTLSYDGYIEGLRGGLGVSLNYNNYQANSLSNYSAEIIYSPKFAVNKTLSIEPALSFKMGVVNLDKSSDIIGNKIEANRHNTTPLFVEENVSSGKQLWYKDVGVGIMFNTKWFYAGVSADNLSRHNNNYYSTDLSKEYKENIHYTAVFGTEYQPLARNFKLNGYALYQNYGGLNELWVGGNFQYKWMIAGAGMSTRLDFGGSAGVILKQFALLYNIDHTHSQLLDKRLLSHQLTMRVFIKPSKRNVIRYANF